MTDLVLKLIAKIDGEPDVMLALWNEGEDLHFAWFGMEAEEAIERLQNVIANLKKAGPSPTRH